MILLIDFHHRINGVTAFRTLNILDQSSRECLEIWVNEKTNSTDIVGVQAYLFVLGSILAYIRSNNGSEFVVEGVCIWIVAGGADTAHIESGSSWGK